jgi:hypothetical protein
MIDIAESLQRSKIMGIIDYYAHLLLQELIYEKRTVWERFESDFRALVQKISEVSMKSILKAGHNLEIRDIMNIIKKEVPTLLKMDIFNPAILKKAVIEELKDNRYKTILSIKDSEDHKSPDKIKIFQDLQKKDAQLQALLKLIPEVFNDLEKEGLYKILLESAISHVSYSVRRDTLHIIFDGDLNKLNYTQFDLNLLFDYLPDEVYFEEVIRKDFIDSILDPHSFLKEVGIVLQHLGTIQQQKRFKTWLVAVSNRLSANLSDIYRSNLIYSVNKIVLGDNEKFWNQI